MQTSAIGMFSSKIKKYRYRVAYLILLAFFEFLKIILTNVVTILMMSAKMVTLDLLKLKVF